MVPADEDQVVSHVLQDEFLHLLRFHAAVEHVAQDDQFMRLRVGEISGLGQRFFEFIEKAVYIGCNIVFHNGDSKALSLFLFHYIISLSLTKDYAMTMQFSTQ